MGIALNEQETTVNFFRDTDTAEVYTSDTTVMTKLDKLVKSGDCPDWELVEEHHSQTGELVAKTYRTKKRLISFRSTIVTRTLTDEQRAVMGERLKKARKLRNADIDAAEAEELLEEEDEYTEFEIGDEEDI